MHTVATERKEAFAVWITGLPASGKSTLSRALAAQLAARGIDAAVLESDALREVFTPEPTYSENERKRFYGQMTWVGRLLVSHGVPVIFDATANRRCLREAARGLIGRFLEVYVDTPIEICKARDPKGIYRRAHNGDADSVPGVQEAYEPPLAPDLVLRGDRDSPDEGAKRILAIMTARGYLAA